MTDEALAWRIEQACFEAWPALEEAPFGDWTARYGAGLSRRINSANPLRPKPEGLERRLPEIEARYRRWSLPPRVRVPSFLPAAVEAQLDRCGFEPEAESLTLFAAIEQAVRGADAQVRIQGAADDGWLAARAKLSNLSAEETDTFGRVVSRLDGPAAYVMLHEQGAASAVAIGVLRHGLVCVEAVVVDAAKRGRGLGRRMLAALFDWAAAQGAAAVCLQVQADNAAGRALYQRLGLTTEVYRYHYRTLWDGRPTSN